MSWYVPLLSSGEDREERNEQLMPRVYGVSISDHFYGDSPATNEQIGLPTTWGVWSHLQLSGRRPISGQTSRRTHLNATTASAPSFAVDNVWVAVCLGFLVRWPSEPAALVRLDGKTVGDAERWRPRSTRRERECVTMGEERESWVCLHF